LVAVLPTISEIESMPQNKSKFTSVFDSIQLSKENTLERLNTSGGHYSTLLQK
jgi:hypothetical protein